MTGSFLYLALRMRVLVQRRRICDEGLVEDGDVARIGGGDLLDERDPLRAPIGWFGA